MASIDFSDIDFEETDFTSEVEANDSHKRRQRAKRLSFEDFYRIFGDDADDDSNWIDDLQESATIDEELTSRSETEYIKIANKIVDTSIGQLKKENQSKKSLKTNLCTFFMWFISIQYIVLIGIFVMGIILGRMPIPSEIVIAYISSIFVETLGAIVLMIKYAFDSSQETQVLGILNGVISNFQKFGGTNSKNNKTN